MPAIDTRKLLRLGGAVAAGGILYLLCSQALHAAVNPRATWWTTTPAILMSRLTMGALVALLIEWLLRRTTDPVITLTGTVLGAIAISSLFVCQSALRNGEAPQPEALAFYGLLAAGVGLLYWMARAASSRLGVDW